jgi:hypothetical protein
MKKLLLAAGVAAFAVAAPTSAKPGEVKGGGQAKAERGHGGHGGGGSKAERRGGGGDRQAFKLERHDGGERLKPARWERKKSERRFSESRGKQRERVFATRKFDSRRFDEPRYQSNRDDRFIAARNSNDGDRWPNAASFANSCPPGLAKKNDGCLPPGQARKMIGTIIPAAYASGYLPAALRDLYRDDDDHFYRYGDGYLYQVDRRSNLVESLLPLFGGGYSVGQQFPLDYPGFAMPSYYRSFYQDSADDYYRFNNGYVYDIDRRSGLIENIIPALGYGYGVGEMLPASYSAYNLPSQYRDVYADEEDYYYRYAPGAIYQVDRDSSLITSVASLLTGGIGVGQPLPAGYSAYNVPYDYRDEYQDTDENWYRYANGNIYQVDPTTQLVTAVIDAIA